MSLGADYTEIQQELGFHLGFGRVIADFSPEDSASIEAWIKSGLRRMLYEAYQTKLENTYDWSFLRRTFTLGTQIGQVEYDLPKDFGSANGPIYWASQKQYYRPIQMFNEPYVRTRLSQLPQVTGIPLCAATFYKRADGALEQRQALVLFPSPDASYVLNLNYNINGDMLTDAFPWPPGGSPHARTLLYACLAEATFRHDDNASYEAQYQLSLAASINYDARTAGDNLGYNSDPKQVEHTWPDERFTDLRVLVHGTQYVFWPLLTLLSMPWQL